MRALKGHRDHRIGVIGRARLLARPSLGGSAAPVSLVALAFSFVPRSAARPLRCHWSRSPSRSSLARRLGRSAGPLRLELWRQRARAHLVVPKAHRVFAPPLGPRLPNASSTWSSRGRRTFVLGWPSTVLRQLDPRNWRLQWSSGFQYEEGPHFACP